MKRKNVLRYLKPYSILGQRQTTIANAFASALAPNDLYDDARTSEALKFLDQDPDADLLCFYCGKAAETWDHIFGLVKLREYAGLGHTLGNLVPCCKDCNSKKGNRDWSDFLDRSIHDVDQRQKKRSVLQAYIDRYGHSRFTQADIGALFVEEMERYRQIQTHILMLMKEADDLASNIRAKVRDRLEHTVDPIAATADVPKLARSM